MNIYLFVESLSETEKEELKNYFLKHEEAKVKEHSLIKIEDFVFKNEMSVRLENTLRTKEVELPDSIRNNKIKDPNEYAFPYANFISKKRFLKIKNAGIKTWKECEKLLVKNNIKFK